ncbi:hypothetical protein FHS43_004826 [Streptosporangium becharense]|uniref:Uncharacterized protein n=1 Tax=Streptosporangium becharense TaxID=1816182 RepID=A0A7W9II95_9ACTN|nr:DUF6529 family protein [Streptosporangium becharense]MBB2913522.1 hypothetical protein [Streptosporangium becharense]MBB5821212.1 hypothetical protein [Streptosporangium becharense]
MGDTQAAPVPRQNLAPLLVPLVVGGLVAVGLGVYGRVHTPTGYAVGPAGFSGPLAMKTWLTTGAFLLALVQVFSALVMWGQITWDVPWIATAHRWSGRAAFLLTVPVAFHCLYALGTQFDVPRVMAHSLLGCFFYGVFVAKMLALPRRGLPGWTLPLLGGLAFTALAGLWLTSSLWFFTTIGVTL